MARILIIDDDTMMCQSLTLVAKRRGHDVISANTLAEGFEQLTSSCCDVVFLDVRMPDGNGLEFLPRIEKLPDPPEVIILTGYGDPHGAELAIKCGAWDYLEKGSSVKDIALSLMRALQYRRQKQTSTSGRSVVALKREGIIGTSPLLEACLNLVAQAAVSDANVLITGETGTGKELIARAVHQNSVRASQGFVVVDCAALPENLVESILFGHERGAYTGADHAREGLIRQADGGTLFLDEIGELPLSMQKAFLRVIQEHRFRPVGSSRELESNFRLVAATNRNLDKLVQEGRFRGDLLFRLRSFSIELPTLRDRIEDLKQLTRFHSDRICERHGIPPKGFSPEFLKTLAAYPWPGNVRELVNSLEWTIAGARLEPILFSKHLPAQIRIQVAQAGVRHSTDAAEVTQAAGVITPQLRVPLQDFRTTVYDQAEKQYLQDLLAATGRDLVEACRISGLSQSRLYALLKKQEISLHE